MKKWLAAILAIALLAISVGVYAEESAPESQPGDAQQTQPLNEQKAEKAPDGKKRNKQTATQERSGETDAVSGATQAPEDQPDSPQGDSGREKERERQETGASSGRRPRHGKKPSQGPTREGSGKIKTGSGQKSGQKPGKERKPRKAGEATALDLESFAAQGILSRETAERAKAYLAQHPLKESAAGAPEMLNALLDAEIITQTEYDAMLSAQTLAS